MKSKTIKTYKSILDQFKLLQVEIDYSRYLADKTDCTIIIENKQSFIHWSEKITSTIDAIHDYSKALNTAVLKGKDHESTLDQLDTAIDELIHLHMEITDSCAHKTSLMEGRYLLEHVVGHYLDQISLHINEFRYQLNRIIFNITDDETAGQQPLPLPMRLHADTELAAFHQWLTAN